jgi:hypothetical protein
LLICIALLGLLIGANIANGFNYFFQKKNWVKYLKWIEQLKWMKKILN